MADALAKAESRGSGGHAAVSVKTRYGYAYGKYQILAPNIAGWTHKAVGKRLTPEEFLDDPEAQDLTTHLILTEKLEQYTPEQVAMWWFTGTAFPQEQIADANGTTAAMYRAKFNRNYE